MTTFNELLTAARTNIQFMYTPWLDKTNHDNVCIDHGLILFIEVETIFSSWNGYSTGFVDYNTCLNAKDPTSQQMLEIFNFLDMDLNRSRCAVVVSSKKEDFKRPFFFINFELLFGLVGSNLYNEQKVSAVLSSFNDEDILRDAWEKGVLLVICEFFGEDCKYLIKYDLAEVKELVVKLAEEMEFFVTDIALKAFEQGHNGIGVSDDARTTFLGFILFAYENIDNTAQTVQLHLEYLLCKAGRGGTGLQLVNLAIQQCQIDYPNYTITVFAEAKPNGIAPNFWLKKLNFALDNDLAIREIYLPAYKVYPGNKF